MRLLGALIAGRVRRATPRAALLSSIAPGVAPRGEAPATRPLSLPIPVVSELYLALTGPDALTYLSVIVPMGLFNAGMALLFGAARWLAVPAEPRAGGPRGPAPTVQRAHALFSAAR